MSNCRIKYRSEIISNAKRIIKANALSYKEGENYIDIPFGVSKNIKDRAQALQVARRKATEVNEIYQQKVFGATVFINHEQERAIRLEIAPSSLLIDAYEVKNGQREPNLLFQTDDRVNYLLKVNQALLSDKVRQPSKNIQGFYNDLQKQGVSKEQIEIIRSLNPENKTKEELIIDLQSNYSFVVEINTASKPKYIPFQGDSEEERENTQYYSNLTVPGGTAYVENEIRTPNIIPSIKSHAQFAGENSIGWHRSDEREFNFELLLKNGEIKEVDC